MKKVYKKNFPINKPPELLTTQVFPDRAFAKETGSFVINECLFAFKGSKVL